MQNQVFPSPAKPKSPHPELPKPQRPPKPEPPEAESLPPQVLHPETPEDPEPPGVAAPRVVWTPSACGWGSFRAKSFDVFVYGRAPFSSKEERDILSANAFHSWRLCSYKIQARSLLKALGARPGRGRALAAQDGAEDVRQVLRYRYIYIYLSIYLSVYLSIYLSIDPEMHRHCAPPSPDVCTRITKDTIVKSNPITLSVNQEGARHRGNGRRVCIQCCCYSSYS